MISPRSALNGRRGDTEKIMFDNLKAMGAIASLMKNKDKIREATERVKVQLANTKLTGNSGQGACKAIVTGTLQVVRVELAPALVSGMAADPKTRELASNLIAEAVNDALKQAQVKIKETVDAEARALGLPELPGLTDLLN